MPAFRMRSSKFRHVFGKPFRKEMCFENIRITKNAHDGCFCAVNTKNIAVVTENAGGGAFVVLPVNQGGRVDMNIPKVSGHSGAILDIKWNPFDNQVIASGSDDSTVKIWQIPNEGLFSNLSDWQVDLHGHQRRVAYIEWHPTASNILLSAGYDFKCFIWNVEQAEPVNVIGCHTDTIFSIAWSREGSMFATTSKDKKLRVIDPRSTNVIAETTGHVGNKASKVAFLEDSMRLLTTGFSRQCDRQLAVWDIRNMTTAQRIDGIDCSNGVIQPYYDPDVRVVFLAGKGDGNIRYFEITDDSSYFHYLSEYMSSSPQKGIGRMPKVGCDVTKCEIQRFYKIHAAKNLLEPVSMIVPRKSEQFQEDIFPPTASTIPSLSADEWVSGQNREPILVSLQDGTVTNTPKVSTSRPVQRQDGAMQANPVITTYTAVTRPGSNRPIKRANTIASSTVPNNVPAAEPASLKNIKRLSINEDIVTIEETSHTLSQKRAMFEQTTNNNNNKNTPQTGPADQNSQYQKKVWSPVSPSSPATTTTANGLPGTDSEQGLSPFKPHSDVSRLELLPMPGNESVESDAVEWRTNEAYQRRKRPLSSNSTPPKSTSSYNSLAKLVIGDPSPQSQSNLKKAYFRQQEELNSLKEQLRLKDKRISQLEDEVQRLRGKDGDQGESNC
ncbi:coronin-2B-like isoform X4 [Haliotis rufescens]|uniref:coronin-2B-like isoform X4 n=1 Tax=Haliotis rufescens TaxID=6454 RepID=UPI00201F168D|nr:coronin-2B-like isoform X4 [Haliotis rufescens]